MNIVRHEAGKREMMRYILKPKNKRKITPRCCATCHYVDNDHNRGYCRRELIPESGLVPDDCWDWTNLEQWFRLCDRWTKQK